MGNKKQAIGGGWLVLTVSSTKVMPVTEKQKMKTWLTERLSNYEVNIVWK